MAWFDDLNLPGATIDGYFGFIQADGPDDNDYPDVVLANGTVTFTATTEAARVDGAWLGIESVTAQIFEGQIVISEEDPRPVRLLATDAPIGVADWAWKASFNVPGFRLNDLTFRAPRNTTVNLTADLIPIKSQPYQIIEGASIVDAEVDTASGLMRFEMSDGSFTQWVDVPNGERGVPGEKGRTGERGADGASASLAMGAVSQGAAADAWMTGTPSARELNLTLPRGSKGERGEAGPRGPLAAPDLVKVSPGVYDVTSSALPLGVDGVIGLADRLAALEQDTGPRDVRSLFSNLDFSGTYAHAILRRVGITVELSVSATCLTSTSSGSNMGVHLPAGFRGHGYGARGTCTVGTVSGTVYSSSAGQALNVSTALVEGQIFKALLRFNSVDSWPTDLPGDPA